MLLNKYDFLLDILRSVSFDGLQLKLLDDITNVGESMIVSKIYNLIERRTPH